MVAVGLVFASLDPKAAPILREVYDAIVADDLPFVLFEGRRSVERQRSYFARGASRIKDDGAHVRGAAIDVILDTRRVPTVGGPWDLGLDDKRKTVVDADVWAAWVSLAHVVVPFHLSGEITWGGAWGANKRLIGWDPYHMEVTGWQKLFKKP